VTRPTAAARAPGPRRRPDPPPRQSRRDGPGNRPARPPPQGKDDDVDAINAARAALHGRRASIPNAKDGAVEALRVLRVTLAHAVREHSSALGCRSSPRRRSFATKSVT
jgi:hypothetical protein